MTQAQNEARKPNRELSALRAYLDRLPPGKVDDPGQVELLLSGCWNDLSVDEGGMTAGKLLGRIENADPEFDPLRSDPRFQDLLRRIGLPP